MSYLEGRYSDTFCIGHSAYKFILDFGQKLIPESNTKYHTRIIMSPEDLRGLLDALEKALSEYKEQYGCVAQDEQ